MAVRPSASKRKRPRKEYIGLEKPPRDYGSAQLQQINQSTLALPVRLAALPPIGIKPFEAAFWGYTYWFGRIGARFAFVPDRSQCTTMDVYTMVDLKGAGVWVAFCWESFWV